jgi:lycopene cyclase domain-containing protein
MAQFHYLMVLAFIGTCAVFVNLGFKLRIRSKLKLFLMTDAVILLIYLAWDFWAVTKGSWYFDREQTVGLYLFARLPIEEVLFFIVVPLMVVLTYLALIKLSRPSSKSENSNDLR